MDEPSLGQLQAVMDAGGKGMQAGYKKFEQECEKTEHALEEWKPADAMIRIEQASREEAERLVAMAREELEDVNESREYDRLVYASKHEEMEKQLTNDEMLKLQDSDVESSKSSESAFGSNDENE